MVAADSPRVILPGRVLAAVLFVVFAVEGVIMLAWRGLPSAWRLSPSAGVLDAVILTLAIAPAVWIVAVEPLAAMIDARGRLLSRLFSAQDDERVRIARELHDGLGQQLTALMLGLRSVENAEDLAAARDGARELRELATRAHADVRALSRGLHPAILDDLGLAPALRRLCEDVARTHGVAVELHGANDLRLPAPIETALYRIAQEALANAGRHAHARSVRIDLARDGGRVTLSIADDGDGFDPSSAGAAPAGLGLASMRERAQALGGDCSVTSRPGGGTTVAVRIPVGGAP